jgi:hypothetical protein
VHAQRHEGSGGTNRIAALPINNELFRHHVILHLSARENSTGIMFRRFDPRANAVMRD